MTAKAVSAFAELAIVVGTETLTVAEDGFDDDAGGFDEDWDADTGGVETGALEGAVVEIGAVLDAAVPDATLETLDVVLETTEALLVTGAVVEELAVQLETTSVAATTTAITPYSRIPDTPHCGPPGEDFIISSASFDTGSRWTQADRTVICPHSVASSHDLSNQSLP
ncbi:hypothetical protein [Nakamurella sp. PAMC28650]|uniref:hypothetical protein n=1 Tax=Nakamurella sp. PAMC28650 TaxID=2762325 RepID=UPI00164E4733|nr:hypothetical protein [Nakamurella sp. PAMC28650]QNK82914.1 hypothetical protein H7F38_09735 [Nakamurella sp. PAMC28650]